MVESYLENKILLETLTVIEESRVGQLLKNAYKRELTHQKMTDFQTLKTNAKAFQYLLFSTISAMFLFKILA